ncbi:type I-B CRISPR-associated protein Cas7/Csh2 [Cuniculiplasma divulgatum]|nr:type I-B CRISPR-associated protein Cas7/Csh2 [Cuniculiplasma divulgatum]MCI2412726.1 type I-B CRISPR-associated protein Cas7/Csh2 [Cuniculiplasma sp.]
MGNEEVKDGEILFVYESKMNNPNGDPDNENIPRMDYSTGTNLVSDVRLKRYIRDYFSDNLKEDKNDIFVKRVEKVQNSTERAKDFNTDPDEIINRCIDIRMFGATITLKSDKGKSDTSAKGKSIKLTGPVQFTWAYSLNQVELVNSYSITTTFSSESGKQQGSMGKDYRVYYSLLAFYGVISSKRAKESKFTDEDLRNLDNAMIMALQSQTTRTKIGQSPLLYLRTEYDKPKFIGDFREYVKLNQGSKPIRSSEDYSLNLESLIQEIKANKECDLAKIWINKRLNVGDRKFLGEKPFNLTNLNE